MPSASATYGVARKRERDKQNQRKKRDRERTYIAQLEARVSELEQGLRRVRAPGTLSTLSSFDQIASPIEATPGSTLPTLHTGQNCFLVHSTVLKSLLDSPIHLRRPLWNVVRPNSSYRFLSRGAGFIALKNALLDDIEVAKACTPIPRFLDLSYGGSSNLLANFVHAEVSNLPFLAPEKFASSYVIYLCLRWLVWPTEENFNAFPALFRPSICQLVREHHLAFDFVPWPQLRDNFINHRADYDLELVLGLFCCTLRISDWFGRDFVRRENDGDPEVMIEFVNHFMDTSHWYLLEKFWVEYPDLVAGLDPSLMFHEKNLEPSPE